MIVLNHHSERRRGGRHVAVEVREPSDRALLGAVREGSGDAFAHLYRRYAKRLRNVVQSQTSRVLASRVDPDDVIQDVYLALFRMVEAGRCQVAEDQSLWDLIVIIALNRVRAVGNWHRAARRDVRRTLGGDLSNQIIRTMAAPEEWPFVDLRLYAGETLERFAAEHRRVVELRLDGYDVASIASAAHLSTRTVDRILRRFRDTLQA